MHFHFISGICGTRNPVDLRASMSPPGLPTSTRIDIGCHLGSNPQSCRHWPIRNPVFDHLGMSHTAQAPGSTFRAQSIFLILRPQEILIWEWIRSFWDSVIAGVIDAVNPITNSPCKDDSYDSLMVIWGMGHLPQRGWDHRISARHHRFLRISSPIQGCDVVQIFLFLLPKENSGSSCGLESQSRDKNPASTWCQVSCVKLEGCNAAKHLRNCGEGRHRKSQ